MGCSASKRGSSDQVEELKRQVDSLQKQIQNNELQSDGIIHAVAIAVPSEVVAPSAPPMQDEYFSKNLSLTDVEWDIVKSGNILIGPGSYYTDDKMITQTSGFIKDEVAAREWIQKINAENPNNPVVMWQFGSGDGREFNSVIWAHHLRFMYQNLDADTGNSPKGFVTSTRNFVQGRGVKGEGTTVYVRSDDWFRSNRLIGLE